MTPPCSRGRKLLFDVWASAVRKISSFSDEWELLYSTLTYDDSLDVDVGEELTRLGHTNLPDSQL
jgi:hypothetical protein